MEVVSGWRVICDSSTVYSYGAQHDDFDAGFNSLVATVCFLWIRRFFTVRRFLTVYGLCFALTASGGSCGGVIIFLNLVGGSTVPNGITFG